MERFKVFPRHATKSFISSMQKTFLLFNCLLMLSEMKSLQLKKFLKICKINSFSLCFYTKTDPMPFSLIFKQCIYTISTSLTQIPMYPNVLQFCWVSISSFLVLKTLPFLHQIFFLFSYEMHRYCG